MEKSKARAHLLLFFLQANIVTRQIEDEDLRMVVDLGPLSSRKVLTKTYDALTKKADEVIEERSVPLECGIETEAALEHQRKAHQEREDVSAEWGAGLIDTEGFRAAIAAIDDQIVRMDACRQQMTVSAVPTRCSTSWNTFRSIQELWPTLGAYFRDGHGTANQKAGWRDPKLKTRVDRQNWALRC
jgi:hypothetical protein